MLDLLLVPNLALYFHQYCHFPVFVIFAGNKRIPRHLPLVDVLVQSNFKHLVALEGPYHFIVFRLLQ